jgi:hypothetical protein
MPSRLRLSPSEPAQPCPSCGYELTLHRTGDALVVYCQRCGYEGSQKREPSRDRWTPEERERRTRKP